MSKGSYIRGAGILAIGGLLSRFIGLFYKALITKMLGSYGMGLYYNTFYIFSLLLSFSVAGVPIALSKMIAEKKALHEFGSIKRIVTTSFVLMSFIGLIFTFIILFYSEHIIKLAGWDENTYYPLIGLSFSPLLVALICVLRGYLQGMKLMTPTAISQIIESLVRLIIGGTLCWYFTYNYNNSMGAGGATFGTTLSATGAFVFLFIYYINNKDKHINNFINQKTQKDSINIIIKRFIAISIPVSISSLIISLYGIVNSFTYVSRLEIAGIDVSVATAMFGDYCNANTLLNIPLTFSMAMAMAIIPSISESFAINDRISIRTKTQLALRMILIVGFPCIIGLSILSNEIFSFIFNESAYGGSLLKYSSYTSLFIMLSIPIQSILHGIDKFSVPIRNLIIGLMIKVILNYTLISMPTINIYGLIISNLVSYFIVAVLNYGLLFKYTKVKIKVYSSIIKPLFSSIVMGIFIRMLYNLLSVLINANFALIITVVLGVAIYFVMLIITNTIVEEEINMLPMGKIFKRIYAILK